MSLRYIFHNAGIRRYLHMEKYVLIPAYCPDVRLPEFVRKLHEEGLHVLIADDGSPAEYTQVFDACAEYAVILHHSENQGKGAALKTMIRWLGANTETEYAAVTADADGQHDISDIIHCLNTAASDHASLVLGVRDFSSENVPARSRTGNSCAAAVFHFITGRKLSDTQTGLRAFHCSLSDDLLAAEGDRYEYEMNMLLMCVRKQIPYREVEIKTIYEGNNECSHFRPVIDTIRILKPLIRFLASSLTGFLIDITMFCLLSMFLPAAAANISARFVSAAANYEINRRYVFQDDSSRAGSTVRYILTACLVLTFNTALLMAFISLGMNRIIAKITAELILFFFSWIMQRSFVFAKGGAAH